MASDYYAQLIRIRRDQLQMDFNRAISALLEKEQHRKSALEAIQLLSEHITAQNLLAAEPAIYAAVQNKYDEVRRIAVQVILQHVVELAGASFDSVFYAVARVLDTKNKPFNEYERSETIRESLLTVLLKLLIFIQNTFTTQTKLEQAHIRYGDLIVQILSKHTKDAYPECKMQVDKCIYRFSRIFKYFITESQIEQLSEAIISNFRHNHSAVRQLNLRAFAELHCAVQSKNINRYLQQLFPVILKDALLTETVADCFYQLLTEHVDRHVYADIFALPLIAGLADQYTFERFTAAGEVYVRENTKIDKFLKLQNEIETCVTGREACFDAFISQFNAVVQPHFCQQLGLGCRVLAQQVLEKQLDAILRDLQSVQQDTKHLSVRLLCNLVILSHNFTLRFGQKFVAALQFMLHDEFNRSVYDRLIWLMAVMCAAGELISSVKTQINSQSGENSRFTARILGFLGKFLYYRRFSADFAPPLTQLEIGDVVDVIGGFDCLFNEDSVMVNAQLSATLNLLRYLQGIAQLQQLTTAQQSRAFLLVAAVAEKLGEQGFFEGRKAQLQELAAVVGSEFQVDAPADVLATFAQFFVDNQTCLNFGDSVIGLQLDGEIVKTDRLQLKCRIFSRFLAFTKDLQFATRNAQKAISFAVRLLRVAADFERHPRAIRQECLECIRVLVDGMALQQDQLIFLLSSLFACTTWKHGARSPECLVLAVRVMTALLRKQTSELRQPLPCVQEEKSSRFGANFDRILSRCCVQLEDDYQSVREETLQLTSALIDYVREFDGQFDELGQKLVLRLDDARESVTLRALDLLSEVIALDKEMFSHAQIAEMLVMHCDDPNTAIRSRCVSLVKQIINQEKYHQACITKAHEMNWQYLTDHSWLE